MKYKILCSDLDGTLLSTKSDVSETTITTLKKITANTKVILVSARMPQSMTYIQKDLGVENEPIICYNGALVLEGSKEIESVTIPLTLLKKIYQLSEEHNIKLGLYYNDEWFVETTSERVEKEIRNTKAIPEYRPTTATFDDWKNRDIAGAHKIMMMGTKNTCDAIYPILDEKFGEQIAIYRSNDTLIEIAPKSVSKLSAIKSLLTDGETLNDIVAFGDNYNDLEMLQHVGCGVAVGNARKEVKEISDYTTLKNTENGVAVFINDHIL